jgi:hypothetical protein
LKRAVRIRSGARSARSSFRHCEEPTGPAFGRPDDKLRDEAIQSCFAAFRIASLALAMAIQGG